MKLEKCEKLSSCLYAYNNKMRPDLMACNQILKVADRDRLTQNHSQSLWRIICAEIQSLPTSQYNDTLITGFGI